MLIEMMLKVCVPIYRIWMGGMAGRSGHLTIINLKGTLLAETGVGKNTNAAVINIRWLLASMFVCSLWEMWH